MFSFFPKKLIFFSKIFIFVILFLVLSTINVSAEENLEDICQWEKIKEQPEDLSVEEYEALLKRCQVFYQEKSDEIEKNIDKTEQEKKTLQNEIYTIRSKIQNLNYQINQSNIVIKDLGFQIEDTEDSIETTSSKIEDTKEKLAGILRRIYEEDRRSIVEVLLLGDLSDFFNNLTALEALDNKNKEILEQIKRLKVDLEGQKEDLGQEKRGLEKMVAVQSLQMKEEEETKKEQEYFLEMTEEEYKQYLSEKKQTEEAVAKISAKLWDLLIGVREVPEYGEVVEVAKLVESQTGVRAAFLLGILTQESRIGRNVGQCFLENTKTGMGVIASTGQKWPRVMKPGRDVPVFLDIIEELNKNNNLGQQWDKTLVSCWIAVCAKYNSGPYCKATVDSSGNVHCTYSSYGAYGWGGAMGPAQFIPSTWNLFKDEIKSRTGQAPDPWDFRHAALASALLLKKCGAITNERGAAVCYLGADYLGYANSVLNFAKCHQNYIDTGTMSLDCQKSIGLR